MCIKLPPDFDDSFNINVLLTGAGFSKDFGALLANELWCYLLDSVKLNENIKKELLKHPDNYEEVYEKLNKNDLSIYNTELLEIFKLMDKNLLYDWEKRNVQTLEKLINIFLSDQKYNFIFTLNQDLLLERYILTQTDNTTSRTSDFPPVGDCITMSDEVRLFFPYLNYNLTKIVRGHDNACVQQPTHYTYEDFEKEIEFNYIPPRKNMINYIKLHGSYNWQDSDGYVTAATGKQKDSYISKSKILKPQWILFEKALKRKVKLLCIGYGFADQHINKIIINSIINYGTELYILQPSPCSSFLHSIKKDKKLTKAVHKGLKGFFPIKLIDIVKHSEHRNKEYYQKLYDSLKRVFI